MSSVTGAEQDAGRTSSSELQGITGGNARAYAKARSMGEAALAPTRACVVSLTLHVSAE
jgi:hypothetical protein